MEFQILPMDNESANLIANWEYDGSYSLYNMGGSIEAIEEMLDGSYFKVLNESNELVGYFCFGKSAQVPTNKSGVYDRLNAIDIGLGLKPNLTGNGLGLSYFTEGLKFAQENFKEEIIRLAVATFNQRAIKVYKKAGFVEKNKFLNKIETNEFILMENNN